VLKEGEMTKMSDETLEALAEVPPSVLRALARVPVEAVQALQALPSEGVKESAPGRHEKSTGEPVFARSEHGALEIAEELGQALNHVDEIMKRADLDVVMTFGKWRDPERPDRQWDWWNGWIDSGGGGVARLLQLPDYEVARVFSVLGSEVRLSILRSLLLKPKSAAGLVADLRRGTTGQAYHHLQELIRAGFVEVRDGTYHVNGGRLRAYFTALAVAADFVPKPSKAPGGELANETDPGVGQ
jgi:DNA-binding HxlR family transcriptional regulator